MARTMTVVKVLEPRVDEDGNLLDKEGEIVDTSKKTKKDQVPEMVEVMYYLHHWGLTYEILIDKDGRYPVSYTIAICEQFKTGIIKTFIPSELAVVGKETR